MFDQCIFFNVSALARQIQRKWQDAFAVVGLSPSHGYLLVALAENEGISQKELSQILELDASTITRFIDALAMKNLIEKQSVGKGARYALTQHGRDMLDQINGIMQGLLSEMKDVFGGDEFELFVKKLSQARQILDA